MAKYIELSAEETISTAELIGKAIEAQMEEAAKKHTEEKERDTDGGH